MDTSNKGSRYLLGQTPDISDCLVDGADTKILAQSPRPRNKGNRDKVTFHVVPVTGKPFTITLKGRDRWALMELIKAGNTGCVSVDYPATRWAAYVFNLKAIGIAIETVTERHEGEFAGNHARYVLRCYVRIADDNGGA